ncbi:phage holin family protein [Flavobacterium johnsoniae]|uniref:Bacteriophage holin family protein n=1 Tax=Flavobacterium johnsoniae TaxID=986 RepID=A0A1M5IGC9_FLAJO|nr:phage holin family protein [Flavobacterium johnsoniae]SHG27368.1 Bacteriophage holin family protein [Flavobacterium johnsoniae]
MKKMDKHSFYELLSKCGNDIKGLIYGAFLFLNINVDVVKVLLWLMLIDTAFGMFKSFRFGRKITFARLFEGVMSKLMCLLIPMVLALVAKGLGYDMKVVPDTILKVLVVAEAFSIVTSFYAIRTKEEPKDVDLITMLLNSLRKGLMSIFSSFLKKVENTVPVDNTEEYKN